MIIFVASAGAGLVVLGIRGAANYAAGKRKAAAFSLNPTATASRATATASPAPKGLQDACPTPPSTPRGEDLWVVGAGTQAGYRAHETFIDITLPHEAVARTDQVAGQLRVRQVDPSQVAIKGGCFAIEQIGRAHV